MQYVVILDSIPQVGYLTDFDRWIFTNFVLLSICVFCHQLVVNSQRKVEKWPFRAVIIRLVEFMGRILVIPISIVYFSEVFSNDDFQETTKKMVIVFFTLFSLVCVREFFGVRKSIRVAISKIAEKVDEDKLECSWIELLALNMYYFKVINFTTEPYEAKKKRTKRMQEEQNMPVLSHEDSNNVDTKIKKSRNRSLLQRFRSYSTYDSDDEL